MSTRLLSLLFLVGLFALPAVARAQLTGSVSAVLTGMSAAAGITFVNSGTSSISTNQGESITATEASFGTWNNSTSSTYNTTVFFNNTSAGKKDIAKIQIAGTFELRLTLTAPVTTTISLGVWNWGMDGASWGSLVNAPDNKMDFLIVGQNDTSYAANYNGASVTWKDNKTGGTFTVTSLSGTTQTSSTYAYTLYGGQLTGAKANDVGVAEGANVTVNAGFQITSVSTVITTVPEPGTYALGATSLLLGAIGMRSVRRRRQAAAKSGPAA
jgi:hypothetical protein